MMRALRFLVGAGLIAFACSRPQQRHEDALVQGAAHALDGGARDVHATVELAFADDGGGVLTGAWVTLDEDAPEGAHLRLALKNAHGDPTLADRLVVLCTTGALRGQRVFVPLDASITPDVTLPVSTAEVTFAARAGGCLRPTLRMELPARPAGAR